ncbi:MAG: serine hydrolase domain-containing protein [Polyangiaceae bacterium]
MVSNLHALTLRLALPPDAPPAVLADELVRSGLAPDVAVGCSIRTSGGWREEVASTGDGTRRLFDLASLTKPMTAVAVALSSASVARTARLGELCPELGDTATASATIELLLAHRAGLEAHIPAYAPLALGEVFDADAAIRKAANARRADAPGEPPPHGFAPIYSDLGYALAGLALARHVGARDAGEAVHRLVIERLGLDGVLGTARELAAAGVDVERTAAPTEDVPWRGGLVVGRVHDENAWALSGVGGSGHAGMFGTASAVLRFGQAVLDGLGGEGPFAGQDLGWLVAPRPGGTLRAGFDGKSPEGSSAGARFGPRSFGHLGFTGTSLWIDPDAGVVAVVLTNRVWPSRARAADAIKAARPIAHDALHAHAASLGAPLRGGPE